MSAQVSRGRPEDWEETTPSDFTTVAKSLRSRSGWCLSKDCGRCAYAPCPCDCHEEMK